ncbi:MAG TPA: hypothetical protein VMD07_08045 [Candidatus Acidoferrales bacterium]|nr:hypothetical protein [Candidatus Acidoferrales bacterium]
MSSDLVLVPEVEARAQLGDRNITLRLLLPPYPAIGLGRLRVLRVKERADATELLCSYEGYERI